jgi:hypothetical protein
MSIILGDQRTVARERAIVMVAGHLLWTAHPSPLMLLQQRHAGGGAMPVRPIKLRLVAPRHPDQLQAAQAL